MAVATAMAAAMAPARRDLRGTEEEGNGAIAAIAPQYQQQLAIVARIAQHGNTATTTTISTGHDKAVAGPKGPPQLL